MFLDLQYKNFICFFFIIFDSNYFQTIQKVVFYKQNNSKMLKCILSCFQTSSGLVTKAKVKAKEKLPVKKWPQIFDMMNRLGLGILKRLRTISCFWFFFVIFLALSEAPFRPFVEESETKIFKPLCLKFYFCFKL